MCMSSGGWRARAMACGHATVTTLSSRSRRLTLRSTLAHLNLAACGLDDDALCLDEPIAALGPSAAGPSSSTGAGSASAGAGSTGLWARLSVLRELSLADNPRVSARACVAILSRVPSLHALDVGGSDFWPEE